MISRRAFVSAAGMLALAGCSTAAPAGSKRASAKQSSKRAKAKSEKTASDVARPSANGRLSVKGAQLVDASGAAVTLHGFSTHGLAWFGQYVNAACFAEMAGWGANLARMAMYTHENGGYCADGDQAELRELVKNGVQYATDADMYAIVDWHVLQDLDPNVYIDQAKEFWSWASETFSASENVIYEICNEPNGDTTWEAVKSYAETIIPIIRANDSKAVILVGTPTWSQRIDQAAANPLTNFKNVMYTLHFYAATHKDELRERLRTAHDGGLPVFVSEYGITDASGNGQIDEDSANTWMNLMNELGVSSACWNLSNKDESSSFIVSTCDKTSEFEDADLTESGRWFKAMLSGDNGTEAAESADAAGSGTNELALTGSSASDGVTASANMRQTWETDGKPYLLYDVTLKAETAQSTWQTALTFSCPVTISESWNCTAQADGSTVTLTPASHNAQMSADQEFSDIGFIVYPS